MLSYLAKKKTEVVGIPNFCTLVYLYITSLQLVIKCPLAVLVFTLHNHNGYFITRGYSLPLCSLRLALSVVRGVQMPELVRVNVF